jgi:arylsulfatase A-like enzyme
MTGKYNFRNWKAFGVMDPGERTFGHVLRDAGYRTCIAGKWQLYSYNPPDFEPEWRGKGMRPEQSGFDEYCLWHAEHTETKGSRYADPVVLENGRYRQDLKGRYGEDVFADFINNFMERNARRPFFVYYPMVLTHGPFNPTPSSKEWKTGNRLRSDRKFFGDMVEYMDLVIGRVVQKLDQLNLRERTLILFFSDNGSPREVRSRMGDRIIQGGKGLTTDEGTHVPLIANWTGVTPKGKVSDDLIDSTDFLVTMTEAAGARLGSEVYDGRSFLPQLHGRKGNPREWVFCHHDPRPGWDKQKFTLQRFARDKRFKLYGDGRLFDVVSDVLEERPLVPGAAGAHAAKARRRLQEVLNSMHL